MEIWQIVLISVAGAIIIGLIVFLVLFIGRRKHLTKQARELEEKYEYFHALLIGQNAQYVRRIEFISRTNLLYSDIYDRSSQQFKNLKDRFDIHASNAIKNLNDLIDKKQYRGFHKVYCTSRDVINVYENEMNKFTASLKKIIKPEEDAHQAVAVLKEQIRNIKQDYFSKQPDMTILIPSFDAVFSKIDKIFEQYDLYVDGAQYDEANVLLNEIKASVRALKKVLATAPQLCVLSQAVVPEKIRTLRATYDEMQKEEIPLHHLMVVTGINELEKELSFISQDLKILKTNDLAGRLDNILVRIDEYLSSFEKEKEAKISFDSEYDHIYETVNALERRFIKLCNFIPEIKKIYVINDAYSARIDEIKAMINEVGGIKRSLDTFVHSSTKQPYTMLVSKMYELNDSSNKVVDALDDFDSYLDSLKANSEEAYELISTYFHRLKEAARALRDMNIFEDNKYSEELKQAYHNLEILSGTLKVLPIDVLKVNKTLEALNDTGNKVINDISKDANMCVLAESAIVFANRDRQHLNDLNKQLAQFELAFFDGEFEKVYYDTGALIKKLHAAEQAPQQTGFLKKNR